jgi:hypothetical protein
MWRWVTRGLVLTVVAALLTPALLAQEFIGVLDSPDPSVPQSGMVLVKGWAIDPQQISKVELFVDDQFQHRLTRFQPLIDVVEAYPNYPGIHNIAPGFQTAFMASRFSNGPHTVFVKVTTGDNRVIEVGRRTIQVDNTINQSPFGSLDIPDGSAAFNASNSFPVVGWATDTDGIARVDVQIDDGNLQPVMYGDARPDVGNAYPDFPAALFSGYIANIDTTRIQDGVHTLTVRATDRLGLSRLIGRRVIQILNTELNLKPFGFIDEPKRDAVLYGNRCGLQPIVSPPVNPSSHITPVRGWALDLGTRASNIGGISYVELVIDGVSWYSTDDCRYNTIFQTEVNCYGRQRYDVQRYYPNYPDVPRAGFLFTMDVGALLASGVRPGPHRLKVRVGDISGTFADIPDRDGIPVTFICSENHGADAGIGFIDVPTTYDYVKGKLLLQGWALQEQGALQAVEIFIDGDYFGDAQYGFPRTDVQQQYPFVFNSTNSGWRFELDTTKLSNTRHRVTVRTRLLNQERTEIGSVDFYVNNPNATP